LSGVLSGLFRVRAFHQDDAHLYMTSEHIKDEILGVLKLSERIYSTFGLGFYLELSTRPEKSIGTDEQWETATKGLASALDTYGQDYQLNEGDGAALLGPDSPVVATAAAQLGEEGPHEGAEHFVRESRVVGTAIAECVRKRQHPLANRNSG